MDASGGRHDIQHKVWKSEWLQGEIEQDINNQLAAVYVFMAFDK